MAILLASFSLLGACSRGAPRALTTAEPDFAPPCPGGRAPGASAPLPPLPWPFGVCRNPDECRALEMARRGPSVVPRLATALSSPDSGVALDAARALFVLGPAAREAVPALLAFDGRTAASVWSGDARTLRIEEALRRAPASDGTAVKMSRGQAFAVLAAPDSDRAAWLVAIEALEQTLPVDTDLASVPALAARLEAEHDRLTRSTSGREVAPVDERMNLLTRAVLALGTNGRPLAPMLRRIEREAAAPIAEQAQDALAFLDDRDRLRIALGILADRTAPWRRVWLAATWAGLLGADAADAMPLLAARLRDAPFDSDVRVVHAVSAIGGAAAVPPLVDALAAPRPSIAAAAADGLASLGAVACAALPALRAAREHWALRVRWAVARALSALEGGPIAPPSPSEARVAENDLLDSAAAGRPARPSPASATPQCPVILGEECVVGRSMGELGGRIDLVPRVRPDGPARTLAHTELGPWGVLPWGDGALAVTRMDHLVRSQARLLVVRRSGSEGWEVRPLVELPGYPIEYRLLADELIVVVEETMHAFDVPVAITAFGIDPAGRVRRVASALPAVGRKRD